MREILSQSTPEALFMSVQLLLQPALKDLTGRSGDCNQSLAATYGAQKDPVQAACRVLCCSGCSNISSPLPFDCASCTGVVS